MQQLALGAMRALAERGARSGWAATPAGPLRYTVRGPTLAPQLLLLHGLGDSLAGWARVVPRLARRYQVHLVDLPGHGLSARPPDFRLATLASAVAHYAQSLSEPILLGHSLGGWIALRLALAKAVRPQALVLVNPGGAPLPREEWGSFRALVSARDRKGVQRYLKAAFHRAPLALRLFPGELIKAMWAEAAQGVLGAIVAEDFLGAAELGTLAMPVHLVWGERDRLLPQGSLDFFRRALPRARVTLLADVGHLPHFEAPRALAQALLR